MGEPFAVAASAIGVVSLGLQVCHGLMSYCESYRSQNSDNAQAYDKIDGLRSTLALLQSSLPQLDPSIAVTAENVKKRILSCSQGVQKLREILVECSQHVVPETYNEKIQKCALKALYPFKDALKSLTLLLRNDKLI